MKLNLFLFMKLAKLSKNHCAKCGLDFTKEMNVCFYKDKKYCNGCYLEVSLRDDLKEKRGLTDQQIDAFFNKVFL